MGGIRTGLDALQFVLAGASAVSVGTAVFGDPSAPVRVLTELEAALDARGFASLADAVGFAHLDKFGRAARLTPAAAEAAAS
jgi:dihydroorotate dehydrogenase (NAD+) catalytic subunit